MAPGIKHLGPSMGAIEQAIEWLEHSVYVQCRTIHDGSSFEAVDRCDAEVDVKRDILMQAIRELVDREVELAVKAERRRAEPVLDGWRSEAIWLRSKLGGDK